MLEIIKDVSKDYKNLLIGGIINLFWFIIFPLFFTLGYIDRAMQSRRYGIKELPRWIHPGNLFIRGSRIFLIIVGYLFIPIIIVLLSSRGVSVSPGAAPKIPVWMFIGGILYLIGSFFIPGAISIYVKNENSLLGAFDIIKIVKLMFSFPKEYLKSYFFWVFANFFSVFVLIIPFYIGFFAFGFVNFYVNLISFLAFAKIGGLGIEKSKGFQPEEEYYSE